MGDCVAVNLNNNLCQIDDLKSWRGAKPTQPEGKTGRRKEISLGFFILSCLPYPSQWDVLDNTSHGTL